MKRPGMRIPGVIVGTLVVLMLPFQPALGIGQCRSGHCNGDEKEVPTKNEWQKCRDQDTIEGCCKNHGGQYSKKGLTGFPICCWDDTPGQGKEGSTTAIKPRTGADVYTPDKQGRPCRQLLGR